jgi:hypothetical protein
MEVPVYSPNFGPLEVELRRARRYERPLSMVVLGLGMAHPEAHRPGAGPFIAPPSPDAGPVLYTFLGGFLRRSLRETDVLAAVPERLMYVAFLPEVDAQAAQEAVRRLASGFFELAGTSLSSGVAQFPGDGFTVADLFHAAARISARRDLPVRPAATLTQDASNA